jgi:chitin disaccharide deacetylase
MIIINADDWGRSAGETDAALACYRARRITSVTAMMFMKDSERAAALAHQHNVDAGLHLNLSEKYNGPLPSAAATEAQARLVRFMARGKFAVLLYHPGLRMEFRNVFQTQLDEFMRLYGRPPSHIDGHQHKHLCTNILLDGILPAGQKVRRNFSFGPGEKGWINRCYRRLVDSSLARRHRITDHFFSLGQCLAAKRLERVFDLAITADVELMTHPVRPEEYAWLMSTVHAEKLRNVEIGSYSTLN